MLQNNIGANLHDEREDFKKIENYYYCMSDEVGQGNFSQVFRGIDQTTGIPVAVKVIKFASLTNKVAKQLVLNETAVLQQLNHDNVIKCRDIFQSRNNCYIITDLYEGGDLEKIIFRSKCLNEKDIREIIYGIYKGLLYLNEHHIVHRDFKPANIFIDANGTPKIADFGFAVRSDKPFKDISIGSPIYMSPEGLILNEYGPKTEVWGLGVMIYEMLHGETPLSKCKTEEELREKVLLPPTFKESISPELKKMMDLCLTVDPKFRIDMKSIANTPYMSKLIAEMEEKSKDLTSTNHTTSSQSKNVFDFVKTIKNYEEGFSLLHYCRLLHKCTEQTPSSILSSWLLDMCWRLTEVKFQGGSKENNNELEKMIKGYAHKYQKEHSRSNAEIGFQDIIEECARLIGKIQQSANTSVIKVKHNNLVMLVGESEILKQAIENNKLHSYAKASQIEKYLLSQKANREC